MKRQQDSIVSSKTKFPFGVILHASHNLSNWLEQSVACFYILTTPQLATCHEGGSHSIHGFECAHERLNVMQVSCLSGTDQQTIDLSTTEVRNLWLENVIGNSYKEGGDCYNILCRLFLGLVVRSISQQLLFLTGECCVLVCCLWCHQPPACWLQFASYTSLCFYTLCFWIALSSL